MYRIISFLSLYSICVHMTLNYQFLISISATRSQHKAVETELNKKRYKVNVKFSVCLTY
jgi:hypothetical protein